MFRSNLAAGSGAVSVTGSNLTWVVVVGVVALLALAVAALLVREVLAASQGTERMQEIAHAVQEGAAAYLRRQFRTLGVFVVIIFFVLLLLPADGSGVRWGRSIFFLVGALFSGLTGFTGMSLAVRGNVRVAAAARAGFDGERPAMRIAFRTGGVAGMFTVGLGLFGAALVVFIYRENAPNVLEGFGFGAALLAMFMRVGGGIFTKAADVGADLVGKVEKGIPDSSLRWALREPLDRDDLPVHRRDAGSQPLEGLHVLAGRPVAGLAGDAGLRPDGAVGVGRGLVVRRELAHVAAEARGVERVGAVGPVELLVRHAREVADGASGGREPLLRFMS